MAVTKTEDIPVPEPVAPPISLSKPPSKLPLILIVSVLLLTFGAGGVFLGKKLSRPSPSSILPTSTLASDQSLNWKSYTSTRHGYSFKYPMTWSALFFKEEDPSVLYGAHSLSNYSVDEVEKFMDHGTVDWKKFIGDKLVIKFDLSVDESGKTIPELINNIGPEAVAQNTSVFVGDNSAQEYSIESPEGPNSKVLIYSVQISPKNIMFISTYVTNITNSNFKNTSEWNEFLQILSTFKFNSTTSSTGPGVAQAKLVSTAGWKSIPAISFSLSYPEVYTGWNPPTHDAISIFPGTSTEGLSIFNISLTGDPQSAKPNSLYTGGSRREWWIRANYDESHPQPPELRFVEKTIGPIDGLEVYNDNSDDSLQAILIAHNKNLYVAGFDSQKINRSTAETIISTLIFK